MTETMLQRLIFSAESDADLMPLYAEGRLENTEFPDTIAAAERAKLKSYTRTSAVIAAGQYVSFATYFNAFPAAYWFRFTPLRKVTLRIEAKGEGKVLVYRSSAKANCYRIETLEIDHDGTYEITLPLAKFRDGGWYWIDAQAGEKDLVLNSVQWVTDVKGRIENPKITIGITTFNRPEDCVLALGQLAESDAVAEVLNEIVVVDQGNKNVVDEENYPQVKQKLGDKLRVITQPNLGGSGGFTRGMYEACQNGSDFVILLDDDVRVEAEGFARAAIFGAMCTKDTIVGGHMFSMYQRTLLHAYAEAVSQKNFWWGPIPGTPANHDFAKLSLRSTPAIHHLAVGNYNGWWMCMIPTKTIKKIGMSLPFFIKWDDSEYGLRAANNGVPTVSLPGVAVWHVPWTDKDDSLDWQAYFHQRNRVVAALMHSKLSHGGRLLPQSTTAQLKHLLSSQYSVVALRNKAIADILRGPEHMHAEIATIVPEVRKLRGQYPDAQAKAEPDAFPPSRVDAKLSKEETLHRPHKHSHRLLMAATGLARHFIKPKKLSRKYPEMYVPFRDAEWIVLSQLDSAVVSNSDGSAASWYQRDPKIFRELLNESNRLHRELWRRWPELSAKYKAAASEVTGTKAWERTLGIDSQAAAEESTLVESTSVKN
ncbi:glycosyl transferase [Boudabousia tangfeifanii]|uniref:Glycosyl transferase n=1 Tax=Boudabousia tangfeifanii TaxID=1912795 RepID=A0A1D9MJT5_9ACTO|nr:glycosyltransferase [Boudabousia tangfeifanii]AOZ72449.1 glycosyl transferase [Boudabousia tangfeifanii]